LVFAIEGNNKMAMTRRELLMILGIGVASISISNKALAKSKYSAVEYLEHITVNDLNVDNDGYKTKHGESIYTALVKLVEEHKMKPIQVRDIIKEKIYANKGKLTAAEEELLWARSRRLRRMTLLNLISV
jgi:hypothetical protein